MANIPFRPITQRTALKIATHRLELAATTESLNCHDSKPQAFHIYASLPESCWWVQAPWGNGKDRYMFRSSRVIVIGRQTGIVHYDGSIGDEG